MNRIRHGVFAGALLVAVSAAGTHVHAAPGVPGQILWQEQVDHAMGMDEVAGMGLRGSKILLVAGVGESAPGSGTDTWIVRAYDAKKDGNLLWDVASTNADGEVTIGGVSASGNRLIVAGSRETAGGQHHLLVRAYDTRSGELLWDDEVDTGVNEGRARAAYIKGKKAWVVGALKDDVTEKTTWWLRYYDAKEGNLAHEDFPAGETDDERGATHLYLQGSTLVVGGVAESLSGDTDWRARAYKTKDHSVLWDETFDSGEGDDEITGLQGMGKRFVIGGTIADPVGTSMHIRTVFTKTGEFQWDATVDEGDSNIAADVVGHGPCLFIGGEVDGDYFVRGFLTLNGDAMWTDRVDSGGYDAAFAMATFGSKTVFAGGTRGDGGGNGDRFIRNYDFHSGDIVWQQVQEVDGDDAMVGIMTKGSSVFTISNVDRDDGSDQDWLVTTHRR